MEKLSDLLEMAKVSDIIATKKEKEDFKNLHSQYFYF